MAGSECSHPQIIMTSSGTSGICALCGKLVANKPKPSKPGQMHPSYHAGSMPGRRKQREIHSSVPHVKTRPHNLEDKQAPGMNVREAALADADRETIGRGKKIVVGNGKKIYMSNDFIRQKTEEYSHRLRSSHKLALVLDIDHTILHASPDPRVKAFKHYPNLKKNIHQLPDGGHVKLRPGLRKMLATLSRFFELFIYTHGTRRYADSVVSILDPDRTLFHNLVGRDDFAKKRPRRGSPGGRGSRVSTQVPKAKDLGDLLNCDPGLVIILDDKPRVWVQSYNVVPCLPFHFFHGLSELYDRNTGAFNQTKSLPRARGRPRNRPRARLRPGPRTAPNVRVEQNDIDETKTAKSINYAQSTNPEPAESTKPARSTKSTKPVEPSDANAVSPENFDDKGDSTGRSNEVSPQYEDPSREKNLEETKGPLRPIKKKENQYQALQPPKLRKQKRLEDPETDQKLGTSQSDGVLGGTGGDDGDDDDGDQRDTEDDVPDHHQDQNMMSINQPRQHTHNHPRKRTQKYQHPVQHPKQHLSAKDHRQGDNYLDFNQAQLKKRDKEPQDNVLLSVQAVLQAIHSLHFNIVPPSQPNAKQNLRLQPQQKCTGSKSKRTESKGVSSASGLDSRMEQLRNAMSGKPVPEILYHLRNSVLKGVRAVFSGVVPKHKRPPQVPEWRLAVELGCVCFESLDSQGLGTGLCSNLHQNDPFLRKITHIVAARAGSEKVKLAMRIGIQVVDIKWLHHAGAHFQKPNENKFRLNGSDNVGDTSKSRYLNVPKPNNQDLPSYNLYHSNSPSTPTSLIRAMASGWKPYPSNEPPNQTPQTQSHPRLGGANARVGGPELTPGAEKREKVLKKSVNKNNEDQARDVGVGNRGESVKKKKMRKKRRRRQEGRRLGSRRRRKDSIALVDSAEIAADVVAGLLGDLK